MQEISTLIPAVSCGLMRFYAEMTGYGLSKFALISCFTTRGILSILGQPPVQFTMGSNHFEVTLYIFVHQENGFTGITLGI